MKQLHRFGFVVSIGFGLGVGQFSWACPGSQCAHSHGHKHTHGHIHEKKGAREFSPHLPALKKTDSIQIRANQKIPLQIHLEPGWKINEKAPTWLALFKKQANDHYQLVQEFKRSEVAKLEVSVPALKSKEEYQLQGSFYFCKEGDGAACSLESRDILVKVMDASEGDQKIEISLPSKK
jgi:hypothetical protein